jgi:hypothetical protein
MRVICIDNRDGKWGVASKLLKEGEIYTAIDCSTDNTCYRIYEIPVDPSDNITIFFKKYRFIPLSEIDEKELVKERELVNN